MNKIISLGVVSLLTISSAVAESNNKSPDVWTVTEVVDMSDNTPVVLQGYITQNIGDERYIFTDDSGSIILEIDDMNMNGKTINGDELITIYGVVDKDDYSTEIDVDTIESN